MKVDSANKNSVKIPLSKFMDGYTYYFSAKTSLNDQNKILEFVYIHSTKTMDIEELPTISEYV